MMTTDKQPTPDDSVTLRKAYLSITNTLMKLDADQRERVLTAVGQTLRVLTKPA